VCGWVSLIVGATLAVLLWSIRGGFKTTSRIESTHLPSFWFRYWPERAYLSFGGSFLLIQLYADSKGAGHANRREKGGTSQSCPGLFRAKRCDAKTIRFDLTVLSRAIPCGGTQIGSNEEVAEVCDLIFLGRITIIHLRGYRADTCQKKIGYLFEVRQTRTPKINPEEGRDYIDAADRWRQDTAILYHRRCRLCIVS